jgi:hypothetical protein
VGAITPKQAADPQPEPAPPCETTPGDVTPGSEVGAIPPKQAADPQPEPAPPCETTPGDITPGAVGGVCNPGTVSAEADPDTLCVTIPGNLILEQ